MDDETQPFDSHLSLLHTGDKFNDKDFDHRLQNTLPFLETVPCEDGLETQVIDFKGETRVPFEDGQETQVMNFEGESETRVPFEDGQETQVMNFEGERETRVPFEDGQETQVMNFEGESETRVPFEDGQETQVMNFEGESETRVPFEDGQETQVMNFEGETQVPFQDELEIQVMNFADETQVLDDFVDFNNTDTKLLDVWNSEEADMTDGEESDRTELLCDTDELSDTDSVKIAACSSEDWENATIPKQDDKENKEELDAQCFKQASAGVKINFTSIRAASLRASGLAARSKALSKSNGELCSSKTKNESLKETHAYAYEDNYATGARESIVRTLKIGVLEDEQRKRDESKAMNRNSAARRLFMDNDKLDEKEGANEIAGLSYVDSQEPGDLSQANALDFVDNFLKSNDTDFDKGVGTVGPILKKSKPESSIKGTQSLAKKSRLNSIVNETGIYDWDDNREDEGGGEFFSRQKKVLFEDEENGLSHSRPASKARSLKKTAKKAKIAELSKNLTKELDEQLNVDSSNGMKICSEKDLQDTYNVGPDTQMAAEAMEVLCLGLDMTDKHTDLNTKNSRKSSSTAGKKEKSLPKKYSFGKRSSLSSDEDPVSNSKRRKKSGKILSNGMSVSSKRNKSAGKQHKDLDFDKSSAVLPSNRQVQVCSFSPIASRTRNHSATRQPISGNIACDIGTLSYNKGKRSHQKMSDNGHQPVNQVSGSETKENGSEISNRSKINLQSFSVNHGITRKTRSSLRVGKVFPSSDRVHVRRLCNQSDEKEELEEDNLKFKHREENFDLNVSPGERSKLSVSTSITPASCTSSVAAASPICMGDEYRKQSCRKNLVREIDSLVSLGSEPSSPMKSSRRRRDMADVRVLFSHHLDDDIIKHQKKILAKLGASVAPSIGEATHFVTNKFVRTRNMLESIAFGKPVVTHLWLESCGQASCCIDEKNYILRDAKKEKEFGFSLPASLAHACQRPLLQGLKVWITPSTKPGVDILSSLVKAVHGLPLERIGRSVLNDEKIPDDLLALSCEEDYATCLPFLEKGGAVFSSELLLNGIVSQKLEFERHRLFDDRVKKTRSTRWPKQNSNKHLPAA